MMDFAMLGKTLCRLGARVQRAPRVPIQQLQLVLSAPFGRRGGRQRPPRHANDPVRAPPWDGRAH